MTMTLTKEERAALELFTEYYRTVGYVSESTIKANTLYIEERENVIVGAALVNHSGEETSVMYSIAVRPRHRNQGIATELTKRSVRDSPHGRVEAKVDADIPATHFYEKSCWEFLRTTVDDRMNVYVCAEGCLDA